METTKYVIKQHSDVNKLLNLIYKARIISFEQAVFFLQKLGLKQKRIDDIINIIRFGGNAFFSNDGYFIAANKMIFEQNYVAAFAKIDKPLWLYLHLMDEYNNVNFDCKFPCLAFLYSDDGTKSLNVFKVSHHKIYDDCNKIDTNFSTPSSKKKAIDSIIIIDDLTDIGDIIFEKTINVIGFAMIRKEVDTQTVKAIFYNKDQTEIEVI